MNAYENFVIRNIEKNWTWGRYGLSANSAITFAFTQFVNKSWEWGKLGFSRNPSITPEIICKRSDIQWDWEDRGISTNPSIDAEFIFQHAEKPFIWDVGGLSANPAINPRVVEFYDSKPWSWGIMGLSSNLAMTEEFVQRNSNKFHYGEYGLSSNPAISIQFMLENPGEWHWGGASLKASVREIENNPEIGWDWKAISRNPLITRDFIYEHAEKLDFGRIGLSGNPAISTDIVEDFRDREWHKETLLRNPSTCGFLEGRAKWEFFEISKNEGISIDFIEKNLNMDWCWDFRGLSRNVMSRELYLEKIGLICDFLDENYNYEKKIINIISSYVAMEELKK